MPSLSQWYVDTELLDFKILIIIRKYIGQNPSIAIGTLIKSPRVTHVARHLPCIRYATKNTIDLHQPQIQTKIRLFNLKNMRLNKKSSTGSLLCQGFSVSTNEIQMSSPFTATADNVEFGTDPIRRLTFLWKETSINDLFVAFLFTVSRDGHSAYLRRERTLSSTYCLV